MKIDLGLRGQLALAFGVLRGATSGAGVGDDTAATTGAGAGVMMGAVMRRSDTSSRTSVRGSTRKRRDTVSKPSADTSNVTVPASTGRGAVMGSVANSTPLTRTTAPGESPRTSSAPRCPAMTSRAPSSAARLRATQGSSVAVSAPRTSRSASSQRPMA